MNAARSRVAWIPPLLVGAAAAASAEMALGLLLYVRADLVGTLTLVLCVQTGALAFGLWMAPRDSAPPWPGVRRAWFLLALAYVGGAVLAASWEALGGLASTWPTRGLGLAMLTALPLYASGLLLGAPGLAEGGSGVGPAALLGATLGFAVVGVAGARFDLAASAYVACMTAVSAAALLQSSLLGARERRWREWAEHGSARAPGALGPEPPAGPTDPGPARGPGPPSSGAPPSGALR